jgi:hypothetical protein
VSQQTLRNWLRRENARGAGPILTDDLRGAGAQPQRAAAAAMPMRRVGLPEEVTRLSVGTVEAGDAGTWGAEGEPDPGCCPGTAAAGQAGVTEIVEMKNRGHALVIEHGWREVAATALAFIQRSTS